MPDISDNNFLLTVGRLILQSVIAVAVTVGGWMLTRAVNTLDTVGQEVTNHTTSLAVIKNGLEYDRTQHNQQFKDIGDIAKDHEVRIRTLEHPPWPSTNRP